MLMGPDKCPEFEVLSLRQVAYLAFTCKLRASSAQSNAFVDL